MQVYDTENKPLLALELLSIVIRHLKEEMLRTIRLQRENVSDDDVMYVMTVPAIWSDAAKQLMREAATDENVSSQFETTLLFSLCIHLLLTVRRVISKMCLFKVKKRLAEFPKGADKPNVYI